MTRPFFPAALALALAVATACSAITAAGPSGPTYRIAISGTT